MIYRTRLLLAAIAITLAVASHPAVAASDFDRAIDLLGKQDFAAAVPILKRLAEEGDADAQAYYGGLLLAGVGVPHDPQAARPWLEKASSGGNAMAAFNLGLMSERGDGVLFDPPQAVRWYEVASERGLSIAMVKLGQAYRDGWGIPANLTEAAKWLRLSADAGDPDAQNLLGVMIAREETAGSRSEAYSWFTLANWAGQPDALKNLDRMRSSLSAADIADGDRRAAGWRPVVTP